MKHRELFIGLSLSPLLQSKATLISELYITNLAKTLWDLFTSFIGLLLPTYSISFSLRLYLPSPFSCLSRITLNLTIGYSDPSPLQRFIVCSRKFHDVLDVLPAVVVVDKGGRQDTLVFVLQSARPKLFILNTLH